MLRTNTGRENVFSVNNAGDAEDLCSDDKTATRSLTTYTYKYRQNKGVSEMFEITSSWGTEGAKIDKWESYNCNASQEQTEQKESKQTTYRIREKFGKYTSKV